MAILISLIAFWISLPRQIQAGWGESSSEIAWGGGEGMAMIPMLLYYAFKGVEFQSSPSQYQFSLVLGSPTFKKHEYYGIIGGNFNDERESSLHDYELQRGWGIGTGYRRWLESNGIGLFGGVRVDLWNNTVKWETVNVRSGSTNQAVFEPSLQFGGRLGWGTPHKYFVDLFVSLGREFNYLPNGDEVGQGNFVRAGTTLGWR